MEFTFLPRDYHIFNKFKKLLGKKYFFNEEEVRDSWNLAKEGRV